MLIALESLTWTLEVLLTPITLNLPPKAQFQPLSQLQSVPPYFFNNQPYPLLFNQVQHQPNPQLLNQVQQEGQNPPLGQWPTQVTPNYNESQPCRSQWQMVPPKNLGYVNSYLGTNVNPNSDFR